MANHHFGEIGDVWKHLPLQAIAADLQPLAYWESHAGSAAYAWSENPGRVFGALRYLDRCGDEPALASAQYTRALREALGQSAPIYPGSPRQMLEALRETGESLVFCDLDGSSLKSIGLEADRLGYRHGAVECLKHDGNRELIDRAVALDGDEAPRVLAMLDPFKLESVGDCGVSSLDALHTLGAAEVPTLLWWCARSPEERTSRQLLIRRAVESATAGSSTTLTITVGDDPDTEATADRFGVWSCAVTLVNIPQRTVDRCAELGKALARVYTEASCVDGAPGLTFEAATHAPKGAAL